MIRVLIVGATSALAEATARLLATEGARFYLVARNGARLEAVGTDLRLRGAASVAMEVMDALDFDRHAAMIADADETLAGIDVALIAHGTLPDQAACERSFAAARAEIETNCLSTLSLLTELANRLEARGSGTIAVISSVAGDRGRKSNYVYGTAKGAVSLFLQGLRNRLHGSGVRVLTIKPGFVDTPMTAGFAKGMLWAQPEEIAAGILRALKRGREEVYLPGYWRVIMLIIRLIPEAVFKRWSL